MLKPKVTWDAQEKNVSVYWISERMLVDICHIYKASRQCGSVNDVLNLREV